ncbi:endoglucanase [Plakobranchus ocellatus]|uniref:Endoglucanase n=1 Tax=Plakobranchus ocellatus TaxID=259542 RepID=A0AAV4CXN9_9GAST|nr:endoglucanase [Plakobranchus ocellatus]
MLRKLATGDSGVQESGIRKLDIPTFVKWTYDSTIGLELRLVLPFATFSYLNCLYIPRFHLVIEVRTWSCHANLELLRLQRGPGDKWAETRRGRIEYAQDLHAADAVYHQQCNINSRTERIIRFWAELSTDLVIEQTLMRSMKSVGGLTRGRGMGDSQRPQWLLSRPACADMNSAMQEVTGSENTTRGQHAESSQFRMRRDDEDMRSFLNFLLSRDPFACDEILRSISTGVNSDRAKEVGHTILESMKDNAVKDYRFRKKEQVGVKASAKVDGETLQVEP